MIYKYTAGLPSTEYTKPYLPDSGKFEWGDETDLSTGLVIKEKATGSEYVWVEVPKTEDVYEKAGTNITNFTDEEYTRIEEDLHKYTSEYRNGTGYKDVYYTDNVDGWFNDENEYNNLKQKMLRSVYQNGGFWVGRYEAGIEDEANIRKDSSSVATLVPVSKQNIYPYNLIKRTQAKVLAEKVESGSYTSSLMFGVQWDLILKFIETKRITTDSNIKKKLNSNSTLIGNYNNNLWNITNVNAKYSTNNGNNFLAKLYKKTLSAGILLTTGADESFSLMNIYDLAGNVWEWTLEKTPYDSVPCTSRGGCYGSNGDEVLVSYRNGSDSINGYRSVGFRVSIY